MDNLKIGELIPISSRYQFFCWIMPCAAMGFYWPFMADFFRACRVQTLVVQLVRRANQSFLDNFVYYYIWSAGLLFYHLSCQMKLKQVILHTDSPRGRRLETPAATTSSLRTHDLTSELLSKYAAPPFF